MIGITADGFFCGRLERRLLEAERWDQQVGKISKEYRGNCDQQACRNLKSTSRPSQAQPRQSEENEGDKNLSRPETRLN